MDVLDARFLTVVATWWLLREIEAAAQKVDDVHLNIRSRTAMLKLSASKKLWGKVVSAHMGAIVMYLMLLGLINFVVLITR